MFRYGIAALALTAGIAFGATPGVAWADSPDSDSGTSTSTSTSTGPGDSSPAQGTDSAAKAATTPDTSGPDDEADGDDETTDESSDTRLDDTPVEADDEAEAEIEPSAPEVDVPTDDDIEPPAPAPAPVPETTKARGGQSDPATPETLVERDTATLEQALVTSSRLKAEPVSATVATLAAPVRTAAVAAADVPVAAVEITTPVAPQPLSPIAQLLELPGRIVNMVLEVLDFTSYANSPTLPIGLGPINDLIFGAFREVERLLGLWDTPPVQPVVPTLVYDGPTDRVTPTVAQFLHAASAAYVLGSTPGDLQPFVVDGFQLAETNIFTGMVGKAWVTPEGQVIIAYQGTTGGTNLLFNPLMVIPQLIADLQVVFTRTTPWAFHNALDFAQRVRAEAALQGYRDEDIFVTGHSLGGWEAQYVSQQIGLAGVGFEAPGINTTVAGNGADSMFVNIGTYGSTAPYMATDLPGLQPFMPPYEPGGGSKPHYGPIVMIGDPAAMTPLYNASTLWGKGLIGSAIFVLDFLVNFFQYHLPAVQAYHLDVIPDPGVVPFLGTARGPVHEGYGELTIPMLLARASDDGILFQP
ncbi:hypothetical protein H7J88_21540 [Mycolicibacterium flavescens]|uniref:PE-PPE domain-containing protein n=2 Tax=Mycolicibacterium flavescens TaxID=1776 RepID=A0A1E3RIH6_MYCFV|nr:hypothetical protein [Mycolicibacterium flavescens]MCV7282218.1 hypothetical protein [Mycolicibacterium flavescens]ODQ89668.1 hypothetical protein BHQ18_14000 [Mycolicibacterium flavescens]